MFYKNFTPANPVMVHRQNTIFLGDIEISTSIPRKTGLTLKEYAMLFIHGKNRRP